MELIFVPCSVPGCKNNAHRGSFGRSGMCCTHYTRMRKHGDVNYLILVKRPALDWIEENSTYSGDDCLTWPFHISKDGYGRCHDPKTNNLATAARIMCTAVNGEPPTQKHHAAHSCGNGNKGCVNPKHIYWATCTQNQRDREKHGTTNRGERYGRSKLTANDVLEIRKLLATHSQIDIAHKFNVDPSHISNISRRKQWAWLDPR